MNKHLLEKLTALLLAGLTTMTAASTVLARSVPASAGTTTQGTSRSEYSVSATGVTRIGGPGGQWITALPMDNPGAKSITITVGLTTASNAVSCGAISYGPTGGLLFQSSIVDFQLSGTFQTQTVTLPSSAVPAGGRVLAICGLTGRTSGNPLLVGFNYNE